MPLFAETVRFERLVKRADADLLARSKALWNKHLLRVPPTNPVTRFQERFGRDLPLLHERGLAHYHAWAFATTRQLGAAFELAASNLRWMQQLGQPGLVDAIAAFDVIAGNCKSFILKGARTVNSKRAFDGTAMFGEMSAAWESGLANLSRAMRSS